MTILDQVGGLDAKFSALDSSICQILEALLKQMSALASKVQCLEKGIVQTTKVVEELHATSRLQMHLGNVPVDELQNALKCSSLEKETNQNTEANNDAASMTTTTGHACVASRDANRFKNLIQFNDDNNEEDEGVEVISCSTSVESKPVE